MMEEITEKLDDILKLNYPPWVHRHIDIPKISLYDAFSRSVDKYKNNIAVDFMGLKISYGQLRDEVDALSFRLSELGITKGDRIAVMLPNIPQYIIFFFAISKLGAIIVQVNPLYTEKEIREELYDSGARSMVVMDEFINKVIKFYPAHLKNIFVVRVKDYLPGVISAIYSLITIRKRPKIPAADKIYICKRPNRIKVSPEPVDIDPQNDPALFQYTGGTTGVPKAAVLTHYNLIANAYQIIEWLPPKYKENLSYLSSIPFFHVYGMMTAMLTPLIQGSKIILVPDPRDIKMTINLMERKKPTAFPGIPTLYHSITQFKNIEKRNIRDVRVCISGAAPLPVELQKKFEELTGAKLVEGYGLSECSPVANITPIYEEDSDKYIRPGSVGMPVPDTYEKIVSIDDGITEMPIGSPGELLIKGPQVMKGYWNRPDENNNVLSDGWLHTGDIAKMDNDGYVYILDRKKDMIIAGGYNIYPREIEEVLYQNPRISECAVIGIRDEHRGETVKAIIVRNDNTLTEDDIINFCRDKLAVYKVPKIIEFRDELPKTLVGKVDKKALRGENENK
ncbi:long-chain-fatty-acid--CoA ligase [Acidiplasma aeolicum]|nr:long-chain fatty acid--CoA ligase [Acidiplasma aeolicum]